MITRSPLATVSLVGLVLQLAACSEGKEAGATSSRGGTGSKSTTSAANGSRGGASTKSSGDGAGAGGTVDTSVDGESSFDGENGGMASGGKATGGQSTSSAKRRGSGGAASTASTTSGGRTSKATGGASSGETSNAAGGKNTAAGAPNSSAAGGSKNTSAASCPATSLAAGDSTKTIQVGGSSRTYVLHVPSTYKGSSPAPLILDFHGMGSSASQQQTRSNYPKATESDGVIVAFPQGMNGPMGAAWNIGPCCVDNVDDVAFVKAMLSEIQSLACIDEQRIYAVGYSMGGGFSHHLACHATDTFAAVAPAAFDLLEDTVADCKPSRPITVVSFRGTSDPMVPYAGGYSDVVPGHAITFLGAEKTFAKWAALNQCTGTPASASGGCQSYSKCSGGVEVWLCSKQGGGHDPGDGSVGWPILKRHALP